MAAMRERRVRGAICETQDEGKSEGIMNESLMCPVVTGMGDGDSERR
jgi:hypothetical protein